MKLGRFLAALGWVFACTAPVVSAQSSEPGTGFRGVLAVRGDRIIASENADQLFTPASVNKLVVAAAALHHLGPKHRIATSLRSDGAIDGTTLNGDLILEAAGDPTWSDRFRDEGAPAALDVLARQLATQGLRRVTGDLVIDIERFPGRPFPVSRPPSEYAYGYAAPTSGLAIDENAVRVEIAPGPRVGASGTARLLAGEAAGSPRLVNRITTVSKERHGVGTVDFLPVWDGETIIVRGEYPINEPSYVIDLSVPSPELHAGRHFLDALSVRGITVDGDVRLSRGDGTGTGPLNSGNGERNVLVRFKSPMLMKLLEPILTDSSNWHAEMLLRVLAAEVEGVGRLDTGLEIERKFLEETVGCSPGSAHLDDASGLSPYNLVTPRCVVTLLRYVQRQPWRNAFLAAMAHNGEGTLKVWARLPPMAAKTGSIRHVLALAGYLELESPDPVIFTVFFNQQPGERGPRRAEIARLLQSWR